MSLGTMTVERCGTGIGDRAKGPVLLTGSAVSKSPRASTKASDARMQSALQGRRVLCVDDFGLDLRRVHKIVSEQGATYGLKVQSTDSPEVALRIVEECALQKAPIDLLVLDGAMKQYHPDGSVTGMNGDELLKLIAKKALIGGWRIPAVVFFSGSHARGLQGFIFKEVEAMRVASNADIPITLVSKDEGPERLLPALAHVARLSETGSQASYGRWLADEFKLDTIESNYETLNRALMARAGHLMCEQAEELLRTVRNKLPAFTENQIFSNVLEAVFFLKNEDRFRFENVNGVTPYASVNQHDFKNGLVVLRSRVGAPIEKLKREKMKGLGEPSADIAAYCKLAEPVYNEIVALASVLVHYDSIRQSVEPATVSLSEKLGQVSRRLPFSNQGTVSISAEKVMISGPSEALLFPLLWQPVQNAIKFADVANCKIDLTLDLISGSALPESAKKFFASRGWTEADNFAHVLVRDNGIGIPEENLPKIFDPNFTTGGTGFGLAFVADQIGSFGGACHVESSVVAPRGTSFHMYFELAKKRAT